MKFLKKTLCVLLSLLMLAALAACTAPDDPAGDNTAPDLTPDAVSSPVPPAYGTEVIPGITVAAEIDQTPILTNGTVELPVIVNQYPYSHGGLGVEVTDVLKQKIEQRLADYLALVEVDYSEFTLNDLGIEDGIYFIDGIPGLDLISAGPTRVTIGLNYPEGTASLDDIKDNPYYAAALAYLGLNDPVIQEYPHLDSSGTVTSVEYVIYETGETPLETIFNRSFSCVTVRFTYGSEDTHISLNIADIPVDKLAAEKAVLSFDEALVCAGLTSSDEVLCEIVYNSEAQYGFYIPVYTFYTREKDSVSAYEVVAVPAVK